MGYIYDLFLIEWDIEKELVIPLGITQDRFFFRRWAKECNINASCLYRELYGVRYEDEEMYMAICQGILEEWEEANKHYLRHIIHDKDAATILKKQRKQKNSLNKLGKVATVDLSGQ